MTKYEKNEVATLNYVKQRTTIPVPTVIVSDSSSENDLGYEWILMEKIPGLVYLTPPKATITRQIRSANAQNLCFPRD